MRWSIRLPRGHVAARLFAFLALAAGALLSACASARPSLTAVGEDEPPIAPPPVRREFRGVWVASVSNIDWPSRPGLPADSQRAELIRMLDKVVELNMNAVVLQVRPAGDALYPSSLEPWSEYLTGQQGRPPAPYYDPLEFAITESHRRGIELHAWFNPYRARHPSARGELDPRHLGVTRPDIVKRYGRHLWMDPGEPDVQDQTVAVIMDVVRRYDVDGIHFDDYFYPYRERDSANVLIPFPDDASWQRYTAAGGTLSRDDWRRSNVDRLVARLWDEIKREKPWVKFGISPFGIWRPGFPPSVRGFDAYDQIYADSRKWLVNGWVDYFTPQLYWAIDAPQQSYPVLLDWWVEQNVHGRHIWPGHGAHRVGTGRANDWKATEIIEQIHRTWAQPGATGDIHFPMRAFMRNADSLSDRIKREAYAMPALVPASPWIDDDPPAAPHIEAEVQPSGEVRVRIWRNGSEEPWLWVVRARFGTEWAQMIVPAGEPGSLVPPPSAASGPPDAVAVSAVDRAGNESGVAVVRVRRGS